MVCMGHLRQKLMPLHNSHPRSKMYLNFNAMSPQTFVKTRKIPLAKRKPHNLWDTGAVALPSGLTGQLGALVIWLSNNYVQTDVTLSGKEKLISRYRRGSHIGKELLDYEYSVKSSSFVQGCGSLYTLPCKSYKNLQDRLKKIARHLSTVVNPNFLHCFTRL